MQSFRKLADTFGQEMKSRSLFGRGSADDVGESVDVPYTGQLEEFDVPRAGGKLTEGRGRHWWIRLGIIVGVLVIAAAIIFKIGIDKGSSRVPAASAISQSEAVRFGLSTFPVAKAAPFAARYLTLCLSPAAGSSSYTGSDARTAELKQMSTAGVDPNCGLNPADSATATPAPESVTFNGQVQSLTGYAQGAAAFLGFDVQYADKAGAPQVVQMTVPVWVDDPNRPVGMRIVGSLGILPPPVDGSPPPYSDSRTQDPQLASALRDSVIRPFLISWASSDQSGLGLATTSSATAAARNGLHGLLTSPIVQTVTVFTTKSAHGGQITYNDGDQVAAETAVQWTNTLNGTKQTASYRITLEQSQGKWLVDDVLAGTLDPSGGPPDQVNTDSSSSDSATSTPSSTTASAPTTSTTSSSATTSSAAAATPPAQPSP